MYIPRFAEITNKRIQRERWTGLKEHEAAIVDYITGWNKSSRKFVRTKKAEDILQSIKKAMTE
jgi:major membrane immunogen (membrane-anchored lipoprotein)